MDNRERLTGQAWHLKDEMPKPGLEWPRPKDHVFHKKTIEPFKIKPCISNWHLASGPSHILESLMSAFALRLVEPAEFCFPYRTG